MNEYQTYREQFKEYGLIEELRHPLVFVRGLPGVALGEVVLFESGALGQVLGFNAELVEVLVLSNERLTPGTEVARAGKQIAVPVGNGLRGQAVNPFGRALIGELPPAEASEERRIDILPPHINSRTGITKPLFTGTTVVDLLLPLARGQREAIIGDPTTGKNSLLLTALRAHAERGIVVYAAIGKPWNDIKKTYNFITQRTKKENVILVAAAAEEVISMIYLAPFAAMTIAEYWRDAGHDVLLILDDLSTHAKFYREIGLLAGRFPARESYPGDVFYLHARLLERGGNFRHPEKGEVSITCLPVAETVRGDMTGYIVSNLISITDGHLLFDETVFSKGRRPAINVPLSVTRVGSHTQSKLVRDLHRKLLVLLNKHEEAQRYTHFGAELHASLQRVLEAGDALLALLSQPLFLTVPYPVQVILAATIWLGWLNGAAADVSHWREQLSAAYEQDPAARAWLEQLLTAANLDQFADRLKAGRPRLLALCQPAAISIKK